MRNLTVVLSLLAVLTIAAPARADVSIDARIVGWPAEGLEAWILGATGTNAFQDIVIHGPVHQGNATSFGTPVPSIYGNFPFGIPQSVIDADTHFLFSQDDVLIGHGTMSETNDGSNVAGLYDYGGHVKYGLGTFGGDLAFAFKDGAVMNGVHLIQVVIPTGCSFYLTATAVDVAAPGRPMVPIEFTLGIPEPATVTLLVAGALCLVVARFRK